MVRPEIDDSAFSQPFARLTQFGSAGANLLGIAVELIRIAQAVRYRRKRWDALARGIIDPSLACPRFLLDSPLPSHRGGDVVPIVWHACASSLRHR